MELIIIFLALGMLVGFALYHRLLSYLRREHEETWISLGRPRLTPRHVLVNVVRGRPSMQRFLWKRQFSELGDPRLTQRCELLRWFIILFVFASPFVILTAVG